MKVAPEGFPFILGGLLASAMFAWLARSVSGGGWTGPAVNTLALLALVFGLFSVWFFRNPSPSIPADARAVVAPAEGKVIEIATVEEPAFMGGASRRISIFLSIFNVHVQRAPLPGQVGLRDYHPGLYLAAWEPKASEANEQATLGIRTAHGPVVVKQIAGLVARRIVTDPDVGDEVGRGARIGLIRFGSRVDLFLPIDWPLEVEVGDKVRAGETVMARVPAQEAGEVTEAR